MSALPQLAVLASGNGTNLQAILDQVESGTLKASVRVVISDKKDAFALQRAKNAGVEGFTLFPKSYASREAHDLALVQLLRERSIDWVILAGYMRILTSTFVRPYWGKIVNLHPALLPNYPGIDAIERAFKAGEKEVGVTVHFVDEGVDTGMVIAQEKIDVREGESLESLTQRVHEVEHRIFPQAIELVLEGKCRMKKREP